MISYIKIDKNKRNYVTIFSALKVTMDAASMQNVSTMMVVTHVNVMMDSKERVILKNGGHTDEITRDVLISMNAKITHSMIVILKQRTVFKRNSIG